MKKFEYVRIGADEEEILSVSKTLVKCWKSAYQGMINDAYLASLKDNHWVDFLKKGLSDDSVDCMLAKEDNQTIGISIFGKSITDDYPNDGEIISLYVLPQFIGQGIGHVLLDKAENRLKEKGYQKSIICVFDENKSAVKFYQSHGFEAVSENNEITMGEQKLLYHIMRKGCINSLEISK